MYAIDFQSKLAGTVTTPAIQIILALLLLLPGLTARAQNNSVYITGRVTDVEDRSSIRDVSVEIKNTGRGTTTDRYGFYFLKAEKKEFALVFSITGYEPVTRNITAKQLASDTIILDVKMKKGILLKEFELTATQKADTVFGTHRFSIMDYEFHRDKFIFLAFEKKAWKVILAGDDEDVLSEFPVPREAGEALELYKDFLGYVNVICEHAIYRVKVKDDKSLALAELPAEDFNTMIRPCIDTVAKKIYFSNYRPDYPRFKYFTYNGEDSTSQQVREIVDKPLALAHDFEYFFLKPRDKLTAMKIAQEYKADKQDVAALMTGFGTSKWFTPLYAPLFIRKDTILIFDHYVNALLKYDTAANLIDSIPIDYHKPKNWKEWERLLVEDESNGELYAVYLKGGYYYLKKIDQATGKITATYKLTNTYVHHIHVRDGYVYYIYRPFESLQKKFLYRERIM